MRVSEETLGNRLRKTNEWKVVRTKSMDITNQWNYESGHGV